MKRLALVGLLVTACSSPPHAGLLPDSATLAAAAATITDDDIRSAITFLASDELRGRDTPSPGLEAAAEWVARRFADAGLTPVDSSWFQRYPYTARRLAAPETAFGVVSGATHFFEYGREFFARRGAPLPDALDAVYTGDAVDGPPASLQDRAVIVRFDAVPYEGPAGLRLPRDTDRAIARLRDRAGEVGAAAVVLITPGLSPDDMAQLAVREEAPDRGLGGADEPLPVFFLADAPARRLFRTAGLDPALVDRTVDRPVPLDGARLRLRAPSETVDDAHPPNVVGMIPGSDPRLSDSYVLLLAHMDHVGVRSPDATGDSIYNGADDNASGTAVLVEVAEAVARLAPRPRRSVVFLAVSGEEKGLLGSYWFSEHPTIPLDRTVAAINIDMVGRNAPDSIVVIGQEYSDLGAMVREVAAGRPDLGLAVGPDPWPEERFFFRSDHFHMARKDVPSLFFFAGTHEDYHRPSDEVDDIDADKAARVGRLIFYLTHAIASASEPPRWDPDGLAEVRRLTR